VWIGSKLHTFSEHINTSANNQFNLDPTKIVPIAIGLTISIGVIIYVWVLASRAIKEVEENQLLIPEEEVKEGCDEKHNLKEMEQIILSDLSVDEPLGANAIFKDDK